MKSTNKLWYKRVFSLLLVMAMLLPIFLVPAQAKNNLATEEAQEKKEARTGAAVSPVAPPADQSKIVTISSVEDMRKIDPSDPEGYYVLNADIVLDKKYEWLQPFCGTFDGRGHTVTFSRKTSYYLFKTIEAGAVIQNVRFAGLIASTYEGEGEYGPCGNAIKGSVINCVSEVSGGYASGFTLNLNGGTISNCVSVGNENGLGGTAIAGRYTDGTVENTYWKNTLKPSDQIPAKAMKNSGAKTEEELNSDALLAALNENRGQYGSEWVKGENGYPVLKPNTPEISTEPEGPYVYFQYDNGEVQKMDSKDTFTLNALDQGTFILAGTDKKADWDCMTQLEYINKHYWINGSGRYCPRHVEKVTATVRNKDNPNEVIKTFYIDNVTSNIEQIKVFVGDQEVSMDKPYQVDGTKRVDINVKGKLKGSEQWVTIPKTQALEYDKAGGDGIIDSTGAFQVSNNGEATFQVTFLENNLQAQFRAVSNHVGLESFHVTVPDVWYIDKWSGLAEGYLGIAQGDDPVKNYQFTYAPANAGNTKLIWKALDPEVATHMYEFHNGIVPKKAGLARFELTSIDNPALTQSISVEFKYLHPLEEASVKEETIYIKEGDYINLEIDTVPANATEQRFHWTYDQEGIVTVGDTINTDPSDVGVHQWITHSLTANSTGVVKVTGTPLDDTANCKPVEFTVHVTKDGERPVEIDYLKLAKEDIAHGVAELKKLDAYGYGKEWNLFTTLRAGESIAQEKLEQYYASVAEKVANDSKNMVPTDFARVVITLEAMGKDPCAVGGVNLLERLYNSDRIENGSSNYPTWALIALDGWKSEIPSDAVWTREKLISKILSFQAENGGFGLFDNKTISMDMTGMVVQALAPYYNDVQYPVVKDAVDRAVAYMKENLSPKGGYPDSCTTSQVLTAVTALKMDPVKAESGFTKGKTNLIGYLHGYKAESGFGYKDASKGDAMSTEQVTYALTSYQRMAEGMTSLYDLTDTMQEKPDEKPDEKPTVSFEDVQPGSYFYEPVIWAVENKITDGVGNNKFNPKGPSTRGQVVTFLWRAAGCPTPTITENPFVDVSSDRYYYIPVLWAVENGITTGVTETKFHPEGICTRGEIVTFLWRFKNEPTPNDTNTGFTDVASSKYYTEAVAWAAENKIVDGVGDNRFAPGNTCVRAQIVTILYRAKDVAPKP